MNAYKEQNYKEAIALFGQVPAQSNNYPEAMLFQGYAFFNEEDYANAVSSFSRVIESGDSRFKENAEWNRTLAYLGWKGIESEDTKETLASILTNQRHGFREQALFLNKKLNSVFRNFVSHTSPPDNQ